MLTDLGLPLLHWLRNTVIHEAHYQIERFDDYLGRWEAFLLHLPYRDWPTSHPEIP